MAATLRGYAQVPGTDDGTNTSDPTSITPVGSMAAGDLCVVITLSRDTTGTHSVSTSGGQTWTSETQVNQSNNRMRVHWCVFNGTWGANPAFSFGSTTCNSVFMIVFQPTSTSYLWKLDQATSGSTYSAPSTPFTVTITGQTTSKISTAIAFWTSVDNNTWGTLSGTGWSKTSLPAQLRNSSGQDTSITAAYNIQSSAGSTNNVSQNQATLGGDAGAIFIGCWYEYIEKTVSDSSTGTDTLAGLLGRIPVSDSGTGSDSLAALLARLTQSDSSTGTDTATKSEQAQLKSVSDTGTGVDSLAELRKKLATISDSGTGVDTVAALRAYIPISDSGTGVDSPAIRKILATISDTGTGVDSVATQQFYRVVISDTGTGVDTLASLLAKIPLSDIGTGVDSVALRKILATISDSGTGVDTVSTNKLVPISVSDLGTGVDTVVKVQSKYYLTISDLGTGVDSLVLINAHLAIQDVSTGLDTVKAEVQTPGKVVSDSGTGVDTARGVCPAYIHDLGAGVETLALDQGESYADVTARHRTASVSPRPRVGDVLQRRITP